MGISICLKLRYQFFFKNPRFWRRQKVKTFQNAEANPGDQRLFVDGAQKGCQVCQDQEEQSQHQAQGEMQPLSLHVGRSRPRKSGEAQAVSPPRTCHSLSISFYFSLPLCLHLSLSPFLNNPC